MVRTINLTTDIPLNREVRIMLPQDVPVGPAELVVVIAPLAGRVRTLGDLARSEFFGMWRDRTDLGDSAEYASQLRSEVWRRAT